MGREGKRGGGSPAFPAGGKACAKLRLVGCLFVWLVGWLVVRFLGCVCVREREMGNEAPALFCLDSVGRLGRVRAPAAQRTVHDDGGDGPLRRLVELWSGACWRVLALEKKEGEM